MRLKFKFASLLAFFFLAFFILSTRDIIVVSANRLFVQTHFIEIEVECLETAINSIRALNGYNLESSIFASTNTQFGWQTRPTANFVRRVDEWAFRHTQEALRELGVVIAEFENSRNIAAQVSDLQVRINAIEEEIVRLSTIMIASDTLGVLITINDRLSNVMHERDRLLGNLNSLLIQTHSPVITIQLIEVYEPGATPPTFFQQLGERFRESLQIILRDIENLIVYLARNFISIIIWVIILIMSWFILRRGIKRIANARIAKAQNVQLQKLETLSKNEEQEAKTLFEELTDNPQLLQSSKNYETNMDIKDNNINENNKDMDGGHI